MVWCLVVYCQVDGLESNFDAFDGGRVVGSLNRGDTAEGQLTCHVVTFRSRYSGLDKYGEPDCTNRKNAAES